MKYTRRQFSGLLVPATFGIFVPRLIRAAIPLQYQTVNRKPVAAGGSCSLLDSFTTASTNDIGICGRDNTVKYCAFWFTPSSSYACCQIDCILYKSGSATWNVSVALFSDTGSNNPNTILGSWSGNLSTADIATTPGGWESFTGSLGSVTSGVKTWIVLQATGFVDWGGTQVNASGVGTVDANDVGRVSADASTWSAYTGSVRPNFRAYG